MPNAQTKTKVSPAAFLNYARRYHEAAEALFDSKPHLSDAINALHFHAVELALKAYMCAHGRKPRATILKIFTKNAVPWDSRSNRRPAWSGERRQPTRFWK